MEKQNRKLPKKLFDIFLLLILPVLVFILWYFMAKRGVLNESVLPGPWKVWETLKKQIAMGTLWGHLEASIFRVLKGYAIGVAAGMIIGVFAALNKTLDRMLTIPIGILRPIPAIALIPFFILWLGIKEESKVAVIMLGSFWPALLNTMQGIKFTDKKLLEVGQLFRKNKLQILLQIIFPAALPSIFTGWRLGISNAWTCVVAAEMIAASKGIGYLISYGRELARPALLLVGVLSIGIIGLLIDLLFIKLQKVIIYWEDPE